MPVRIGRPTLCLAMILGLSAGWDADCRAAGLYTVTDPGPDASALHPTLGLTLSDADKAALPSVEVMQGASFPTPKSFQLNPWQNTDSGVVLGTVPSGADGANPLFSEVFGFTTRHADGTFGPFTYLTYQDPFADPQHSGIVGFASLDAKGEALITNGQGQKLIDLNTGISTDLTTLLPPGTLDHDGFSSVILHATISADGTIFAEVHATSGHFPDGSDVHTLMLTPPLATPEPSTLATFAMIAVGLAVARGRSKG